MTSRLRQPLQYVLAYLLWIGTLPLALYAAYMVRALYLLPFQLAARPGLSQGARLDLQMQRGAADRFGIVLLLAGMVVLTVWLEHYYRTGAEQGRLLPCFFLAMTIIMGIVFVTDVVVSSQAIASGRLTLASLSLVAVKLALLVLFAGLYTRLAKRSGGG